MTKDKVRSTEEALKQRIGMAQPNRGSVGFQEALMSGTDGAQPEQSTECGEPVAWVDLELWTNDETWPDDCFSHLHVEGWTPLYTSPPQRKPLTDEEIYDMYNEPRSDAEMIAFARAIEAAHGIIAPTELKGEA